MSEAKQLAGKARVDSSLGVYYNFTEEEFKRFCAIHAKEQREICADEAMVEYDYGDTWVDRKSILNANQPEIFE